MMRTTSFITIKGSDHTVNEDYIVCTDQFVVVSDGMGGVNNGEVASKITADTIKSQLSDLAIDNLSADSIKELMSKAFYCADQAILTYSKDHPESLGMGATAITVYFKDDTAYISWCGDSRCYLYNTDDGLRCLTKDHSYVQQLIDSGEITPEQAYTHPDNNLITRYVGAGDDTCQPDFTTHCIKEADLLIICSDGLSGYCKDNHIKRAIESCSDFDTLPKTLTNLAVQHGSEDDITVAVIKGGNKPKGFFNWFKRK